ncbi:hypothetical protein HK102_010037, partial [Quaeritorhiza haematococci]
PDRRHRLAAGLVLPQLRHLVAFGRRGPPAGHQRADLSLQLHERGGRPRDHAAAEEHHGPLARAGVAPDLGAGGQRHELRAAHGDGDVVHAVRTPDRPRRPVVPLARRHARPDRRLLREDRPARAGLRRRADPHLPGEPGAQVPLDDRAAGGDLRDEDQDDPHRRRRVQEHAPLPVRRRRLRPAGPRRAGRGHGHRQHPDAGVRPQPDRLAPGPPRHRRPLVPRHRLRAAPHRRLGRRQRPLPGAGEVL